MSWRFRKLAKERWISLLAGLSSLLALIVIALGAFTRLQDAGLGCPDWPGCYGQWIVSFKEAPQHDVIYKAWVEMTHRYVVGILGFFCVAILYAILRYRPSRSNVILGGILVVLLIYQIVLGKWTVTFKLLPVVVIQHLLGGFFIFATLSLIYVTNRKENLLPPSRPYSKTLCFLASIGCLLLIGQIILGAMVSTHYAALACPDFPICSYQTLKVSSDLQFKQTLHMMHRLGALIWTLYVVGFLVWAFSSTKKTPEIQKPFYILIFLLFLQISLGVSNVLFKLPLFSAVSHTVVAALLLATFLMLIARCRS
jgi:cytochrome c oxidase assembly protein subunit 15